MRVSFLGLGAIGWPMAGHLARAFDLTVWNRTRARAEAFAREHRALVAASPRDAADGADVVMTCLPTSADVEQLLDGPLTQALSALVSFPDATATSSAWRKAVQQTSATGIPQRTFHNWRRRLLELGFVEKRSDARHAYRVTDAGRTAIGR